MVETIAPVVYGRRSRYIAAVVLHTTGAAVTGALFGATVALVGTILGAPWGNAGVVVVAAVALLYAARELGGLPIPTFDRKQQVPDWWRTFYSPLTAAALYGAGLGIGFLTFLRYGTYVAACAVALASGNPVLGAIIGASFGIARGATAIVNARSRDEQAAAMTVRRLESIASTTKPQIANGLTCAAVAVAALTVLA